MKKPYFVFIFLLIGVLPRLALANSTAFFEGEIDLQKKIFRINILSEGKDVCEVKGKFDRKDIQVSLNVSHFKTPFLELSTQIFGSLTPRVNKDEQNNGYQGRLWSRYSLVDFKPVDELTGEFLITKDKIDFKKVNFGKLSLTGSLLRKYPYKASFIIGLDTVSLEKFLKFWVPRKQYDTQGDVSGTVKISSNQQKISLQGKLKSFNGHINSFQFDSFYLNARGIYPVLKIEDSTVSKEDGLIFSLAGDFDLKSPKGFKNQIKKLKLSPIVNESDTEKSWTIKRLRSEDTSTTEIKYMLRKSGGSGNDSSLDDGMLGVEKTMEF
ncbi:hypothetical protein MNBD_BACTEROID05-1183 [hydrothermal vent metagenome]|uniref:Uncharacterized protein n=1 Tax=hydrothermal vent metagenome TaxID=652676 RepID=A0A3B0TLL7_9ZZZZ